MRYVYAIILCLVVVAVQAQTDSLVPPSQDSIVAPQKVDKRHSPRKAALLSLGLPGAGQAYNKKYWKMPIVYGLIGGASYFVAQNAKDYRGYRNAYRLQVDGDSTTVGNYRGIEEANFLRTLRDETRTNLDLSIIALVAAYGLQILDATIDAHLFEFDVSDDLSMRVEPIIHLPAPGQHQHYGLAFSIQL